MVTITHKQTKKDDHKIHRYNRTGLPVVEILEATASYNRKLVLLLTRNMYELCKYLPCVIHIAPGSI